jgi:hypothetical protein
MKSTFQRIQELQDLLDSGEYVGEISFPDGTKIKYERAEARAELRRLEKQYAREQNKRPRIATFRLD